MIHEELTLKMFVNFNHLFHSLLPLDCFLGLGNSRVEPSLWSVSKCSKLCLSNRTEPQEATYSPSDALKIMITENGSFFVIASQQQQHKHAEAEEADNSV
jgi:hypothetical protein